MDYYIHDIDPRIFSLGSLEVRWYGLMYLTGFVVGYLIIKSRYKKGYAGITPLQTQDLITYLMIGMMVGARITYALVYNWDYYSQNIAEIFMIWKGGLSFHGAVLGFVVAMIKFAKKYKLQYWHIADNVALVGALGIFFGRWGNFTNGELWGRITDVPWAVVFKAAGPEPRHPSQLYQSFAEGLCVFILLLLIDRYQRKKHLSLDGPNKKGKIKAKWENTGFLASFFILGYGIARFIVEFFRQPDAQLGFYFGYFSMGQILCFIMIVVGSLMIWYRTKNPIGFEYTVDVNAK
ncbi:MAG: prolipoprotein diacylglyceryl transferase [Bdellovibrionales bacterium]